MLNYHYTDVEQKQLLKSIVILIDKREQDRHVAEYLQGKGIPYKDYSLSSGDYSVMLPATQDLGIVRDMYFDRKIIIERKADLNELSGNLAQYRERFEHEFERVPNCRKYLLIEGGCYSDIFTNNYSTGLNSAAFIASLLTFQCRFGINVSFVSKEHSGKFIHALLYYYIREIIQ